MTPLDPAVAEDEFDLGLHDLVERRLLLEEDGNYLAVFIFGIRLPAN